MVVKFAKNNIITSGKSRNCQIGKDKIFFEEVREFIDDSRKNQTLYANFEGRHERRVNACDLTPLDRIVFLTLSYGKDRTSLTPEEFSEADKLTKLMVQKILHSSSKFKINEIRFQVLWIYYFDYLEEEVKSMPVFKLYKRDQGSEAYYIDVTTAGYESWDHFIMHGSFPISFICIPRRGEYTFRSINGEDLLDLEYICKNSEIVNNFQRTSRPVSQTLIKPLLHKLVPYFEDAAGLLRAVSHFITIIGEDLIPGANWIAIVISTVAICLRVLEKMLKENSEDGSESIAEDYSLMLLNEKAEKPLSWLKRLNLVTDAIERPQKNLTFNGFIKLLKNPKENVLEILKLVPVLIEISGFLFCTFVGIREAGNREPDIHNWISVFECLSLLTRKVLGNAKEIGSKSSAYPLSDLEKYSWQKVVSSSDASPERSTRQGMSNRSLDLSPLQESGFDFFGFRVHFLVGEKILNCGGFLQNLLKSNFTLRGNTPFQEITLDGELIGIVVSFSIRGQNVALFALRLDKLPQINK